MAMFLQNLIMKFSFTQPTFHPRPTEREREMGEKQVADSYRITPMLELSLHNNNNTH